jgi:hypothetical protein
MSKRSARARKAAASKPSLPAGSSLPLALTLVPPVIGLLLIGAWALDISIFGEAQLGIAILFILLGFAASNAVQRRWRRATGWGLLTVADLVLMIWPEFWAQGAAIGLGLLGLAFIGIEFYRQYRQSGLETQKK